MWDTVLGDAITKERSRRESTVDQTQRFRQKLAETAKEAKRISRGLWRRDLSRVRIKASTCLSTLTGRLCGRFGISAMHSAETVCWSLDRLLFGLLLDRPGMLLSTRVWTEDIACTCAWKKESAMSCLWVVPHAAFRGGPFFPYK